MPFVLELALAGGVEGSPAGRSLAVPVLVLHAGFRSKDAPENNLEASVAAARIMRHCFTDPGYCGPLPTRYRG